MKNALILIVIILVIVGGFFLFKTFNGTSTNPLPVGKTIEVILSQQGESGESGTATLTDVDGKLKVAIKLIGAPVGVAQPAHIHTGSCENLGSPRYTLTDVSGGNSETELTGVSVNQLLGELPLAINVHKSAQEASVYISCGTIVAPGTEALEVMATTSTQQIVATSTASTTNVTATSTTASTSEEL